MKTTRLPSRFTFADYNDLSLALGKLGFLVDFSFMRSSFKSNAPKEIVRAAVADIVSDLTHLDNLACVGLTPAGLA